MGNNNVLELLRERAGGTQRSTGGNDVAARLRERAKGASYTPQLPSVENTNAALAEVRQRQEQEEAKRRELQHLQNQEFIQTYGTPYSNRFEGLQQGEVNALWNRFVDAHTEQAPTTEPLLGDKGPTQAGIDQRVNELINQRTEREDALKATNSGSYQNDKLKRWSNAEERLRLQGEIDDINAQLEALGVYDADADYFGRMFLGGALGTVEGIVNEANYLGKGYMESEAAQNENMMRALGMLFGDKYKGVAESYAEDRRGLQAQEMAPIVDFATKYNAATQGKYTAINETDAFVGDVLQGIGGMAPAMISNIAVPGSSLFVMMSGAAGNATTEAKQAGVSDGAAMLYGFSVGAVEGITEAMFAGTGKLLNKTGLADKLVFKAVKKALANDTASQMAVKKLADVLGEGFEEFVAELAGKGLNDLLVGSDERTWGQTLQDAIESGVLGVVIGGILQSSSLIGPRTTPKQAADIVANEIIRQANNPQNFASEGVMPTDNNVPAEAGKVAEIRPDSPGLAQAREQQTKGGDYGYGEYGNAAFEQVMTDFALDADSARTVFQTAYEAGKLDTDRTKIELVNPIQERAFEAGKKDYVLSRKDAANGTETVHLREGGQRLGGQNTRGQVRSLEESAGRNQSGQTQSRIADSETASLTYGSKVSTASLGIGGGSRIANIRVVTGGDTTATRAARQLAKARGLRVIFFEGNNLEIHRDSGEKVSARAYITGDRVFIRVDHAEYTADQLMRHEAGHDMIAKGEVDISEVRRRIDRTFGKEKAGQLADMYAEAYEGTGMSAEEIWEEVVCDSLGDMNIFSETANEANAWELLQQTKAASIETQIEGIRGPPAEGKASVATLPDGKKYVRAERQVVFGSDPDAWSEQLEDYINGKIRRGEDVKLVAADGDILTLTADTAGKVASPYKGAARMSDEAFERKVSAGSHIDELAQASVRGKRNAKDENAKHGDMAAGGWNYRTAYFLDFDNTYYECTISVSIGKQGNAVYNIGEMKKRSFPTVPKALTGSSADSGAQRGKASVDTNVSQDEAKVNSHLDSLGRKLSDKQADYFAESKVRDAGGRLKVMYRGGTEDFTVFDRKKSSYSNLYGRGFYFTDSESHARQYGNAREFYLDIKNPVPTDKRTIKKSQMLAFLEAVAENEDDYSFENYGYGASPESVLRSVFSGKSDFAMLYDVSQTAIGDMVEAVELFNEVNGTDFDGLILDTETVTFSSEQAKYVSNLAPTSDPDVRYSRDLETIKEMREDNAQMRLANEELEKLFRSGTIAKLDKKTLSTFAKDIVKGAGSSMNVSEVTEKLRDLHNYLIAGEDGSRGKWDSAYEQSYEIAAEILENATTTDDSMYQQYRELRDTIRNTGISISREYDGDMEGYEGINDFRKANYGRIKIVKDGRPVDSFYEELAESYPEFFDSAEHTNPADQLNHIAEVLDSLRPFEVNPFSYNMKEASAWLANDIMMRFYRVQNEKLADTIQKGKDKALRARRREIAKRDEKIKKLKEKQRAKEKKMSERRQARILRDRIARHASAMSQKLLRPTDKQHIPQKLQGAVAKLLESINLESAFDYVPGSQRQTSRGATIGDRAEKGSGDPTKRTQAFNEIRKLYKELAGELVYDPDMDDILMEVIALADKPVAAMNNADLETLWKALRAVENTISTANKTFIQGRWQTVSDAAEAIRRDNAEKKNKPELRGILGQAQKLTGLDMMTPEAYFHRLGAAGDTMFRMMRDAQDKHIRMMSDISDFTHKELGEVDVRKLEKEMHTVALGGEQVQLSTAQLMELYVLMRREQAIEHISVGGILPDSVDSKGIKKVSRAKPVRGITAEELSAALNELTDEQVNIAKKLQEYSSTTLSKWGNEAAMQVYNYEKFGEKNYWPIRVNKQETQSDVNKDSAVVAIGGKGFTKATTPHANNSVRIGSIFDTFSTHSSEMATYAAWLATSEDINRIRNFTFRDPDSKQRTDTVKAIIETVHGKQGTAYLQKLLEDISNGVKGKHSDTGYMSGLAGNYKAASVGANIRVMIQQPTAILRALDMIDGKYLAGGLKPNKGWEKAVKYAPIAKWKDWGYFDINTGRQMKDVLFDSDSRLNKVRQSLMAGAGKMDSLAWGQLWNAVEAEVKDKNKTINPDSDAFYEAVAKRFTEIVDHTQVVDGILQRSQIMRSADGLTKMATSFMGEPTKQYNMMLTAAYDAANAKSDGKKSAKKRLARTVTALVLSGVTNAIAQSIVDALRDDDREKDYWEKWLEAFTGFTGEEETFGERFMAFWSGNLEAILNPAQYVPYAKDVVSILQGYDVSRMDMEGLEKTISAFQNMMKALRGEGSYTVANAFANMFAESSRLLGVPVANLKRDIMAFVNLIANETDNYFFQYRIEKASLNLNYSANSARFMDILFKAYVLDPDAYEIIYADMVASGFEPERIKSGMESRMKEAYGVNDVKLLPQRYMTPEQQKSYDAVMDKVEQSDIWKNADARARTNVSYDYYEAVTGASAAERFVSKMEVAKQYGIDSVQFLLYDVALQMADKPNEQGSYGSYTNDEYIDAINAVPGLSRAEKSDFWEEVLGKSEKTNPWG